MFYGFVIPREHLGALIDSLYWTPIPPNVNYSSNCLATLHISDSIRDTCGISGAGFYAARRSHDQPVYQCCSEQQFETIWLACWRIAKARRYTWLVSRSQPQWEDSHSDAWYWSRKCRLVPLKSEEVYVHEPNESDGEEATDEESTDNSSEGPVTEDVSTRNGTYRWDILKS